MFSPPSAAPPFAPKAASSLPLGQAPRAIKPLAATRGAEAFHSAFLHSQIGQGLLDGDATWTEVNVALAQLVGRDPAALQGTSLFDMLAAEGWEQVQDQWRHALPADDAPHDERAVPLRHADGSTREVLLTLTPLPGDNLSPPRVLAEIEDVTARMERQRAHEAARAELSSRNEALQSFASTASHDLKAPLRQLRMYAALLQETHADHLAPDARQLLGRMEATTQRLHDLVERLLTQHTTSADAAPATQCVDLNAVLQEVLSDLPTGDATIRTGHLPIVQADPTDMHRLLQNLLSNALKFHEGPGQALVQVIAAARDGRCYLTVSDNGVGFVPEEAARLFQPMVRLHEHEGFEGNGLGLAICQRIARRYGGEVLARGCPGRGAAFTVSLPLAG